mgnify:CR=1 FL=1|uniref:Uncharacterized protein n=1 Tax=Siphoviridae sp. ctBCr48 TaxID=2827802 RepID=A0A8S5SHK2_9CAUD|nr:MAG TPA: hypothetical protein [Siphoviridae sp. ctBCr48]
MTNHKFNWTRVEDLILMDMKKNRCNTQRHRYCY